MNQLQQWQQSHGAPLALGVKVIVSETSDLHSDFKDEVFAVSGLIFDGYDPSSDRVDVAITDQDGEAYDGFSPDELELVKAQ